MAAEARERLIEGEGTPPRRRPEHEVVRITAERDRLAADVLMARASLAAAPTPAAKRTWGLDGRLLVADLRRMCREASLDASVAH